MKTIQKIMVAYDFSDYSKNALEFAVQLADELKSNLMIVNVINQREVDALKRAEMEGSGVSVDQFIKDNKKDRLNLINEVVEKLSAKHLTVEVKIKIGVPGLPLVPMMTSLKPSLSMSPTPIDNACMAEPRSL